MIQALKYNPKLCQKKVGNYGQFLLSFWLVFLDFWTGAQRKDYI